MKDTAHSREPLAHWLQLHSHQTSVTIRRAGSLLLTPSLFFSILCLETSNVLLNWITAKMYLLYCVCCLLCCVFFKSIKYLMPVFPSFLGESRTSSDATATMWRRLGTSSDGKTAGTNMAVMQRSNCSPGATVSSAPWKPVSCSRTSSHWCRANASFRDHQQHS